MYKGSNNYANDYKEMSEIKKFADKYGMAIIVIHHMKKGYESDSFNKVSGTNGITGTADTMITLEKENRSNETTILSINGRDVEYNQYIIKFNPEKCKWEMIANYEDNKKIQESNNYYSDTLVTIIRELVNKNNGKWSGTRKELSEYIQNNYSDCVDYKVNDKRLKPIIPLLKKYDNIVFYDPGYPSNGRREIIFKKKDVGNVENVDIVGSIPTNSTKTTNNIEGNV